MINPSADPKRFASYERELAHQEREAGDHDAVEDSADVGGDPAVAFFVRSLGCGISLTPT